VLRAATLSASPADTHWCLVGAICTMFETNFICRTFLCFARLGGSVFSCPTEVEVDIIFYEDSSYCITKIEDLVVCTPDFSVISPGTRMTLDRRYFHFLPLHHEGGWCVKGRYLVESRGELLMVVRYSHMLSDETSSFGVFRRSTEPVAPSGPYYAWERLTDLDGRLIFVGRGNSRCYEVECLGRNKPGVYCHDDDAFNMPAMVAYGYNGQHFPCYDNGCWPGPGERVRKW
jgi:hypothetical protein